MMARLQMMDYAAQFEAGRNDGHNLITELCNFDGTTSSEQLLVESLGIVVSLAANNRCSESNARLVGFSAVVAPLLLTACDADPEVNEVITLKERLASLESKCVLYAASLRNADEELIRLNKIIQHTDSEGGEL